MALSCASILISPFRKLSNFVISIFRASFLLSSCSRDWWHFTTMPVNQIKFLITRLGSFGPHVYYSVLKCLYIIQNANHSKCVFTLSLYEFLYILEAIAYLTIKLSTMKLIIDDDAQPFLRSWLSQVKKPLPFMATEASLFTKMCHCPVS